MKRELRKLFDARVEAVLKTLPPEVLDVINNDVPLLVEDYPSDEVMETMGIEYRDELCGLFTGVDITEKSIDAPPLTPDSVVIYREGIIVQALDADESLPDEFFEQLDPELNSLKPDDLKLELLDEEIRVTILHEYGHLHGLSDDDLEALGY